MAIKKMSSQDFNEILESSQTKIKDMNDSISVVKNNIDKKLLIIKHETEYISEYVHKLSYQRPHNTPENNSGVAKDGIYIMLNNNYKGLYESYSNVVHAFFKKEPLNIFNLRSVTSKKPYFRDEVNVSINGITTDYYKNILKADDHDTKEIFFEEYSNDVEVKKTEENISYMSNDSSIEISIEVDKQKVIGISKFNMIEIDPYLYQSFDIEKIDIYGENYDKPLYTTDKLEKVGKTRIVLDKKYNFKKVVFTITPKYISTNNGEQVKPFGLKHIFFYDADFRNDSYVIVQYDSSEFIDHIKNDMEIETPYGSFSTSIKDEGIKIYLENNNGILSNEQEPSMTTKKPIARNLKRIFFKIPITSETKENSLYKESIIALKLYIENR